MLTAAEQALFRRLSVFVGGWRLSAAEQVASAVGTLNLDILDGLASLLDKSLLLRESDGDGEARYRLLYVLREFGLEHLQVAGEQEDTRNAHAVFFLALAEEVDRQLQSQYRKEWAEVGREEHENMRAALTWCLERAEQTGDMEAAERALRLYAALTPFWISHFHFHEAQAFLETALALRSGVTRPVQVRMALAAAFLRVSTDDLVEGEAFAGECIALARQEGDLLNTVWALLLLGEIAVHRDQYALGQAYYEEAAAHLQEAEVAKERDYYFLFLHQVMVIQGEYEQARALAEESLTIFYEWGDQQCISQALVRLGWDLFVSQGELARATSLVEQGLEIMRALGDVGFVAEMAYYLGVIHRHQGKLDEAQTLLEESLSLGQEQWAPSERFIRQTELARSLTQQGKVAEARAIYRQNRGFLSTSGFRWLVAEYLEGLAALQVSLGAPETAVRLWGAAEALREAIGAPMFPVDRAAYASAITAARTQLGKEAFASAWSEGRKQTPEDAVATID